MLVEYVQLTDSIDHGVALESLLELCAHKVIAWTTVGKDRKVDVEPKEVHNDWDQDQTEGSCPEVVHELLHGQLTANIQKLPQIPQDSNTNGGDSEETDHLDTKL